MKSIKTWWSYINTSVFFIICKKQFVIILIDTNSYADIKNRYDFNEEILYSL